MTNMHGLVCLDKPNKDSKRISSTSSTMTRSMIMKPINPKNPDQQQENIDQKNRELLIWDCGSPLYDSYELVSLSHLIERHFMILPLSSLAGSKRFVARLRPTAPRAASVGPANTPTAGAGPTHAASTWKRAASKKIKACTRILAMYNKIVPWKKY